MPRTKNLTPIVNRTNAMQMVSQNAPDEEIHEGVIYQNINDADDQKAGFVQYALYPVDPNVKDGGDHYQKLDRIGLNVNYY